MSMIAFLIAAVVLAITPGPGIAYVVARTVAGGRSEGLASCIGTGLGGLLHVLAAALGLSLLVAESALAFGLLKYLGAAYLVYLGVLMLRRKDAAFVLPGVAAQGAARALREGILVEALNVKTALFFWRFCRSSSRHPCRWRRSWWCWAAFAWCSILWWMWRRCSPRSGCWPPGRRGRRGRRGPGC